MTNHVTSHERSLVVNSEELHHTYVIPDDHFQHPTPLNEIPGLALIPSLADIRHAFSLHILSLCLERKIVNRDLKRKRECRVKSAGTEKGKFPPWSSTDNRPFKHGRHQLRKAIIRSLVAGASLANAYSQPTDRCRTFYNYLRTTRWMANGAGPGYPIDEFAASYTFHGTFPEAMIGSLTPFGIVTMGLIGYEQKTTKLEPAQASYVREHAVYYTPTPQTTASEHSRRLTDETEVFSHLAQWLVHTILSDTAARAEHAERFRLGLGRASVCPGTDKCPLDVNHLPISFMSQNTATNRSRPTYSHADAHFIH